MKRYPRPRQFRPNHPEKYLGDVSKIIARSSWEVKFMHWCDINSSILKWNSEGVVIPYWSSAEGKMRRYFVDFLIQAVSTDNEVKSFLVEVKPRAQTKPPRNRKNQTALLEAARTYQINQDKWKAASAWAKAQGIEFRVLDEYDLGIKNANNK